MFERYAVKARRVIFFARYEASQFGSSAIDAEHLLLGLLRENQDLLARFLPDKELSTTDIRDRVKQVIGQNEKISESVDLPLTSRAKDVLNYAAEESMQRQDGYIGTEHLLLGLLREDKGISSTILHEFGLNVELVLGRMKHQERGLTDEGELRDSLKVLISEMRGLATNLLEKSDRMEDLLDKQPSEENERDNNQ